MAYGRAEPELKRSETQPPQHTLRPLEWIGNPVQVGGPPLPLPLPVFMFPSTILGDQAWPQITPSPSVTASHTVMHLSQS